VIFTGDLLDFCSYFTPYPCGQTRKEKTAF
jgi:hypothetical protein